MANSTEITTIATVLGVNLEWLRDGEGPKLANRVVAQSNAIPIVGRVAAGMWLAQALVSRKIRNDINPFPPDPRYPEQSQFDLIVEDSSVDRFAVAGSRLRCLEVSALGRDIREGDLVVIERRRADITEMTARSIKITENGPEYLFESNDPLWQDPLTAQQLNPGEELSIRAIVLYAYRPWK
jgi:hypothetical protein